MVAVKPMKTVGVLALQGDFDKHLRVLSSLGVKGLPVRNESEFASLDALIIPGGESTTMTHLIKENDLEPVLRKFVKTKPVMGTCAGLILLANQTKSEKVLGLGAIDLNLERNGFGRQLHSFSSDISLDFTNGTPFHAIFIRAPKILNLGEGVVPLAMLSDEVVMARNSNVIVASFHPELTDNRSIHKYFINQLVVSEEDSN